MPFTCPEFPGRVFNSLEELRNLRDEKAQLLKRMLAKKVTVVVEEESKES